MVSKFKIAAMIAGVILAVPLLVGKTAPQAAKARDDYSGMYSFLRDGEFVQITIEDDGRLTGFVSRYGDTESDRGAFLDQFFKQGKLDGDKLSFTTQTVHGVSYEFTGTIGRGEGKALSEEGYYVMRGTLAESRTDSEKKTNSKSREVTFKSFPREEQSAPATRNSR